MEAPALTSPFSDEDTGPSVLIHRLQDVRALSWVRGAEADFLVGGRGRKAGKKGGCAEDLEADGVSLDLNGQRWLL